MSLEMITALVSQGSGEEKMSCYLERTLNYAWHIISRMQVFVK